MAPNVIDLRLPQFPEISDPEAFKEFTNIYNALRQLAEGIATYTGTTVIPPSGTADPGLTPDKTILIQNINKLSIQAIEAISAGHMVHITTGGQARKAQIPTYPAHGFCLDASGIAAGATGIICVGRGLNTYIGGLTPGKFYWLSATPGIITNYPVDSIENVGTAMLSDTNPVNHGTYWQNFSGKQQAVGFAINSTMLYVSIQAPLV